MGWCFLHKQWCYNNVFFLISSFFFAQFPYLFAKPSQKKLEDQTQTGATALLNLSKKEHLCLKRLQSSHQHQKRHKKKPLLLCKVKTSGFLLQSCWTTPERSSYFLVCLALWSLTTVAISGAAFLPLPASFLILSSVCLYSRWRSSGGTEINWIRSYV